ncbi:hypothetical protein KFK09_017849 [Dendrobium nobile]|uniref:Uncharacterized protein n=1 Tax=Dendrobium nobile TaxID=94219 RepID=A0A8T3AU45_DENNO|nr:hypothetical protein KFK09_017849 [Dendrobium nobile]
MCTALGFRVETLEVMMGKQPGEIISNLPLLSSADGKDTMVKNAFDQRLVPPTDFPPIVNVSEGTAKYVNIPILVMSNANLKTHVVRSLNKSILVQSDWLDLNESLSTPCVGEEEDFDDYVNDDMYSFMVGCVVDQAVLNGSGKRRKVNLRKNSLWISLSLLMQWALLAFWMMMRRLLAFHVVNPGLLASLMVSPFCWVVACVDSRLMVFLSGCH